MNRRVDNKNKVSIDMVAERFAEILISQIELKKTRKYNKTKNNLKTTEKYE